MSSLCTLQISKPLNFYDNSKLDRCTDEIVISDDKSSDINKSSTISNQFLLKGIVLNCQSIQAKKPAFHAMVHQYHPDFIVGTESWLTADILNNEIFPHGYNIYRKDRPDGYGGVFFACRDNILCRQLSLNTTCEIVACKLNVDNFAPLIILSIYRPPYRDIEYMQNLCDLVEEIITEHFDCTIWITGDLNLPDIDWNTHSIVGSNYPVGLSSLFLDLLNYSGCVQLNNVPTRANNILDIFATNKPSLISHCCVVPGVSDHEALYIESLLILSVLPPFQRKVFLWNKADFSHINNLMSHWCSQFLSSNTVDTPIQELWDKFKSSCLKCMDLIPTKSTSKKFHQPWITSHIKRLTKRKQRLYNRAKASKLESDWTAYCNIKKWSNLNVGNHMTSTYPISLIQTLTVATSGYGHILKT